MGHRYWIGAESEVERITCETSVDVAVSSTFAVAIDLKKGRARFVGIFVITADFPASWNYALQALTDNDSRCHAAHVQLQTRSADIRVASQLSEKIELQL